MKLKRKQKQSTVIKVRIVPALGDIHTDWEHEEACQNARNVDYMDVCVSVCVHMYIIWLHGYIKVSCFNLMTKLMLYCISLYLKKKQIKNKIEDIDREHLEQISGDGWRGWD